MDETQSKGQKPPRKPRRYVEEAVEYVDNRRQRAVLMGVFIILFLLLIAATYAVIRLSTPTTIPDEAEVPEGLTWVRSIYGWGKGAKEQLVSPTDVAVGPDGTIWCLSEHSAVVAFNPDGSARGVLRPKMAGSLEGISIDENGDIWVADFVGKIMHLKPDGSVVATYGVQAPNELDVVDGKIAVAAARGIAVFTPDDEILMQFGTRGQEDDQFDLPHGIMLAQDRIYVSDTQNQRVRAFTSEGRPIWTLGTAPDRSKYDSGDFRSANSSAPFELPTGMTMDAKGRIVLVDAFKFQIIAVDSETGKIPRDSAKHLARYGEQGNADGLFMYPTGIDYDPVRDWFVVADTGNNRLQIVRIPDSGGTAANRVIGALAPPMCILLLPLLLLLIAVIVSVMRRRRELKEQQAAADAPSPVTS